MSDPHRDGIWAGNEAEVEEARLRFSENPREGVYAFISALYSFREIERYRRELIERAHTAAELGDRFVRESSPGAVDASLADRIDVVSSVLLWLLEQEDVRMANRRALVSVTEKLIRLGLRTAPYEPGGHTFPLLATTYALFLLSRWHHLASMGAKEQVRHMRAHHRLAHALAPFVDDPRQRARVWRRVGAIYLKRWNPIGLWYVWGPAAVLAKNVPWDVRRKSIFFWH